MKIKWTLTVKNDFHYSIGLYSWQMWHEMHSKVDVKLHRLYVPYLLSISQIDNSFIMQTNGEKSTLSRIILRTIELL